MATTLTIKDKNGTEYVLVPGKSLTLSDITMDGGGNIEFDGPSELPTEVEYGATGNFIIRAGTTNFEYTINGGTDWYQLDGELSRDNGTGGNARIYYNTTSEKWMVDNDDGGAAFEIVTGGSGTDDNAIHDNVAGEIIAVTEKASPIAADVVLIEDTEDTNNKKRVQVGNLPGGSGTDDDAIHDNVAGEIAAVSAKASPVSADYFLIEDSEDSNNKKRIQYSQLPAGGADAAAIHVDQTGEIAGLTEKSSPIGADILVIEDSAAANAKKKVQITNLPGGGSGDMTKAVYDTTANDIVDKAESLDDTTNTVTAAQARTHLDDATTHRVINDSGTLTTELFSASKINTELGNKSSTGHSHSNALHDDVAGEITAITEKASPVSADVLVIEDSEDSSNKKRVQITNLPGGSGTDADALHDNVSGEIAAITEKASPVSGDLIVIEDSEATNAKKRVQVGNLPGGSGTDADAIHDNVASEISAVTEKASPVDADLLLIEDSADTNNKKRIQVGNLPFLDVAEKGAADGIAELDVGGKVPVAQLPSAALQAGATSFNGIADSITLLGQVDARTAQETRGILYSRGVAGRTQDAYTTVLVESDSTHGDTTIIDSGPTGHTLTANGDSVFHSTVRQHFGTSALYFGGTDDAISFPNHAGFDLADQDFTIDFWVNFSVAPNAKVVFDRNFDTTPQWLFYFVNSTSCQFYYSIDGVGNSTIDWSGYTAMQLDTWYHLAIVRYNDTIDFYIDGEGVNSQAFTATIYNGNTKFTLGGQGNDSDTTIQGDYTGYVDEFRISKGVARWTTDFVPPSMPYTYETIDLSYVTSDGVEHSLLTEQSYANEQSLVQQLLSVSQSTEAITVQYPNGWVDTLVDTDVIDAAESSGYVHLDPGIGIDVGGVAFSHDISASESGDLIDDGWNWRQVIPVAELSSFGTGETITVSIRGGQTSQVNINNMFIGEQADSGDLWDFDGNQVRVTFNTGSSSVTAAIDTVVVSDEISFTLTGTSNIIVAWDQAASAGKQPRDLTTATGLDLYYINYAASTYESHLTDPSGYGVAADRIDLVQSIDIVPPLSYTVVTTQHTRSSAPGLGIPYVHYYPNEATILGTDFQLYQSADDGGTWEEITPLTNYTTLSDGSYVLLPDQAFIASNTQTRLKVVSSADVDILGIGHLFDISKSVAQTAREFIQSKETLSDSLLAHEIVGEQGSLPRQEGQYGWMESCATANSVDEGQSSNYIHDPVDDTLSNIQAQETASYTLDIGTGNASGKYTERETILGSELGVSGSRIRFKLETGPSGALMDIDQAWFGLQASSGNAYDYDGNQVQVTFNGGQTSIQNIPFNTSFWTDWITFSLDETETYVFGWDWSKEGWSMDYSTSLTNRLYYIADVNDAHVTAPSGTYSQTNFYLISSIEVGTGYATSEIITYPFEVTPEPSSGAFLLHYTPVDTVNIGTDLRIYQSLDDGGTWEEFTSPVTLKNLADGSKVLYANQAFTASSDQTTRLRLVGANSKLYYIHGISHLFDIDTVVSQGTSLSLTDDTTTVNDLQTLRVNPASGFSVTDDGGNQATINLGSSWNPISVSGQTDLDATGEEELEIEAGTNITLTTNTGTTPKKLTITGDDQTFDGTLDAVLSLQEQNSSPTQSSGYGQLWSTPGTFDDTLLLIQSDTTDGSTTITDSSSSAYSIGNSGSVRHEVDQAKFGATSLFFPARADILTVTPTGSELDLSGDYTIDFWVYLTDISVSMNFLGKGNITAVEQSWQIWFDTTDDTIQFYFTDDGSSWTQVTKTTNTVTTGQWYHIEASRSGSTHYLFLDGTLEDTTVDASTYYVSSHPLRIGMFDDAAPASGFLGYIDEFRISTVNRHTTTFTPETASYQASSKSLKFMTGAGDTHDIITHLDDASLHFTEASVDHTNITNKGTNTHAEIDTHLGDDTKHRIINDSGTNATELWSASKINTELGSVTGGLNYIGTWNASTNTPDVPASSPSNGDYYKVSVAGSTSLGGITDWDVADWAIYNGSEWQKIDNSEVVNNLNLDSLTEKASPVSADILVIEDTEDSNNLKKVQLTNLPGGSGTDDDAIHDNIAAEISSVTEKASPVDTDLLLIEDSEAANVKKKIQAGNLPFIGASEKGSADGVASLNSSSLVPNIQLPTNVLNTSYIPHSLYKQVTDASVTKTNYTVAVNGPFAIVDETRDILYAMGGYNAGTPQGVYKYSKALDSWSLTTAMGTPRARVSGLVYNDKAYIVGGMTASSTPSAVVEYFDFSDETWTSITSLTAARIWPAVGQHDGILYVVGGDNSGMTNTVYSYDMSGGDAGSWTTESTAPYSNGYAAYAQRGSKLYIIGGNSPAVDTVYAFDMSDQTWDTLATKPTPTAYVPGLLIDDHIIYTIGGYAGGVITQIEYYDINEDAWYVADTQLAAAWSTYAGAVYDNKIFRIGGYSGSEENDVITYALPAEGDAVVDQTAIHDDTSGEIVLLTEKGTPISADLIIIEDSADSNSKKKVQVGNLPGGAGSFALDARSIGADTQTFSDTLTEDSGGWYDWTVRQVIPASALSNDLANVVLTFEGGSTEGIDVSAIYIGYQASSGNEWDFDGNQVEVTFGGTSGVTIGAGLTAESDTIDFVLDSTKDIIVTYDFNNNQSADELIRGTLYADTDFALYYKQVTNEASSTAPTGYSAYADTAATIVDITGGLLTEDSIDGYTLIEGDNITFDIDTGNDELTITSTGGGTSESRLTYRIAGGPLVTTTNADGAKIANRTGTIQAIYITCDDTGTAGSALTIDVLKGGTSIYTGGGTKPTIAANTGTFQYNVSTDPNDTSVSATDLFVIEIESAPDDATGLTCEIIIQ